jgi:hypothetical protein
MSETTNSIKAGRSFMMVTVANRPWPILNVPDIHLSDRPGRRSPAGTNLDRSGRPPTRPKPVRLAGMKATWLNQSPEQRNIRREL